MSDEPPHPVPERLADFEVIRRLGAGGMAEVFLAKRRGAEGLSLIHISEPTRPY